MADEVQITIRVIAFLVFAAYMVDMFFGRKPSEESPCIKCDYVSCPCNAARGWCIKRNI